MTTVYNMDNYIRRLKELSISTRKHPNFKANLIFNKDSPEMKINNEAFIPFINERDGLGRLICCVRFISKNRTPIKNDLQEILLRNIIV